MVQSVSAAFLFPAATRSWFGWNGTLD